MDAICCFGTNGLEGTWSIEVANWKILSQTSWLLKHSYGENISLFKPNSQLYSQNRGTKHIRYHPYFKIINRSIDPALSKQKVRDGIHMIDTAFRIFVSYCSFTSDKSRNEFSKTYRETLRSIYAVFELHKAIIGKMMQEEMASGFQLLCSEEDVEKLKDLFHRIFFWANQEFVQRCIRMFSLIRKEPIKCFYLSER